MTPTGSSNAQQSAQLQQLQKPYIKILQRRISEFRTFIQTNGKKPLSAEEMEILHMRIHNLMGSGAIYGFAGVSEAASRLDNMLNASEVAWGSPRLTQAFQDLIKASEEALRSTANLQEVPVHFARPTFDHADPARSVLLVVDDDPAIHDLVSALLSDSAQVVNAYNSDEAAEATQRYFPDLILLDNYMPGVNGLALLERLRDSSRTAAVPVMMMTAERQDFIKLRAMEAGIVEYIAKPFDPMQFADKIFGFLSRFHMTVLVASENMTERQMLAKKLRQQGLEVLEAADCSGAFDLARNDVPELLILDACMKDSDAVLRMLHEHHATRSIPILNLTLKQSGAPANDFFRENVVDYVATTFMPAEIVARTLQMLGLDTATDAVAV